MSTDAWTSARRACETLALELEREGASASASASARARATAVRRRKVNRLDDLLDILEDRVDEGDATASEVVTREAEVRALRLRARAVRETMARAATGGGDDAATGAATDGARATAAAIGRGVSEAAGAVVDAAGALATRATKAAEGVAGLERAVTMATAASTRDARETRAMNTRELIDHQTEQMKTQDEALEGLDALVGTLKTTSVAIHDEVELQRKLVEDLEADFAHTSDRMRKLRKQGFKLAGERNEEERERLDRNEALAEMRAKLEKPAQDESSCSIM